MTTQTTIQDMMEHNFIGRCDSNSNYRQVSSLEEVMDHKVLVCTRNLISKSGSHYLAEAKDQKKNLHYVLKNNAVCLSNITSS